MEAIPCRYGVAPDLISGGRVEKICTAEHDTAVTLTHGRLRGRPVRDKCAPCIGPHVFSLSLSRAMEMIFRVHGYYK